MNAHKKGNPLISFVAWGGLMAILFTFFLKKMSDYDFWFHLVVGRETVATGTVPDRAFYIYQFLGVPDKFYEWGFGVVLYSIYSASGVSALSVLNAACAALAIFMLANIKSSNAQPAVFVAATALAASIIALYVDIRAVLRPEIMLAALIGIEIYLLEKFREKQEIVYLLALPVLALLLTNIHPSSIFLIAIAGIYGLSHWLAERTQHMLAVYSVLLLSMLLCGGINPYGFEQVFLPFKFAGDSKLLAHVIEFFPIYQTAYLWPFMLLSFAVAASAFVPQGKSKLARLMLAAIFWILTLRYTRNIALFAVVSYLPVRDLLIFAISHVERKTSRTVPVFLAGLAVFVLVGVLTGTRIRDGNWGSGVDETGYPTQAYLLAGNKNITAIASLFHLGGYLTWVTGIPVLADGRNYTFNSALQDHNNIFSRQPDWNRLLEKNGIDVIFTPLLQPHAKEPVPVLGALYYSPDWKLCAIEESGIWFIRSSKTASNGLNKNLIFHRMMADILKSNVPQREANPVYALAKSIGNPDLLQTMYTPEENCTELRPNY